jgi:hypothetical protein
VGQSAGPLCTLQDAGQVMMPEASLSILFSQLIATAIHGITNLMTTSSRMLAY